MEHGENLRLRDTYVNSLARSLSSGNALANVPSLLKKVIAEQMWRERFVTQTKQVITFKSFREFVEADPPEGLKANVNLLIRICTDYEDLEAVSLISTEVGGKPGGNNNPYGMMGKPDDNRIKVSNTNIDSVDKPSRGDTTDFVIRRLSKQRPDIHARVIAGELSPNAAAIEAGYRKEKFQLPRDPVAAGRYLAYRVDKDWLMECVDAYMKEAHEPPTA